MPDAIGQTLSLNGVRQRVVAVVPDASRTRSSPGVEIWTPLDLQTPAGPWGNHYLSVVGRIRPGATLEQAQAELRALPRRSSRTTARLELIRGARDAAAG